MERASATSSSGCERLPCTRVSTGSWMRPSRLVRSVSVTVTVPLGGMSPAQGLASSTASACDCMSCGATSKCAGSLDSLTSTISRT